MALTVLSYGAGQDSATLLAMYRHDHQFRRSYASNDFLVIFSDTGNEHPETYQYLRKTQELCAAEKIAFRWIVPEWGFHAKGWHSLDEQMNLHGTIGSKAFPKSCTDKLKVQVIYRFLAAWVARFHTELEMSGKYRGKAPLVAYAERYGRIRMLLGIASGEERRIAKGAVRPKWQQLAIEPVYPLMEMGFDRQSCQEYLRGVGEIVPWPSCCLKCPWANLRELLWLSLDFPEVYADWVRQEQVKLDKNRDQEKNLGVWGGTKTLPEMLEISKQKYGDMTIEQLREYRFSHGHCSQSSY